ncbi:AraC family transcriptional regulator [Cellulomonas sp. PhB143]|uniref:AraC family transcriptional regulator n=1 Tax=Cellulomonas sp. PhB143 TaxID=2485186 RepID=UPI000F487970|nr:AraC family transcriptional regulator [Cellulomonas sp. PhB143]ROS73596.1 AraC-like DNA-binding protein [Cellulomonas sp. PhB143]
MNVLLDTRAVPAHERVDAFGSAFNAASRPTDVSVTSDVVGVVQAWEMSTGVRMVRLDVRATEVRVNRSSRHLRLAGPERLSVASSMLGTCLTTNHGRQETSNDALRLTDMTATYGIVQQGRCRAVAVEIDYADLGLSVDEVRRALPHTAASPLHALVRRHLADVAGTVSSVDVAARSALAAAKVHLVRGMLTSVAGRGADRREAEPATLRLRIEDYVRRHLAEPGLTPASIAAAHHISLRHLYAVLADLEHAPAEWVMRLRLDAARRALVVPGATVADVARRWGFKDPSHFTRRFKDCYGAPPRDYAVRAVRLATQRERPDA